MKTMKYTKYYSKQQRGMAFIEVMLAALVLVVGCVGFLKLQRIGLRSSFNDYARAQGVAVSQGFIDGLRGNIRFLSVVDTMNDNNELPKMSSFVSSSTMPVANPPQDNGDCQAGVPDEDCAKAVLDYQKYVANTYMQRALPGDGRSVLCYHLAKEPLGAMRVTFLWLDNTSSDRGALTTDSCRGFEVEPAAAMSAAPTSDLLKHSVSIYAQL